MYNHLSINPDYIYVKTKEMIALNNSIYKNLALISRRAIADQEYFNGVVEFDNADHSFTLRMTLLIYREPLLDPADKTHSATRITDIVPVWWECATMDKGGVVWNDFCWQEFKEFLF